MGELKSEYFGSDNPKWADEVRGYIKNGDVKKLAAIFDICDTTERELIMLECSDALLDKIF